jgi:hypothetical protein
MVRPILFLVFVATIFGQSDRGSIIGIVSDPKARLIQNLEIDAKNLETGKQYSAETNATGQYRIVGLPAGSYEVSAKVRGFDDVHVNVKAGELEPGRVDIVLKQR